MPAGIVLHPKRGAFPGHALLFTGDDFHTIFIQQSPAIAPTHYGIAILQRSTADRPSSAFAKAVVQMGS